MSCGGPGASPREGCTLAPWHGCAPRSFQCLRWQVYRLRMHHVKGSPAGGLLYFWEDFLHPRKLPPLGELSLRMGLEPMGHKDYELLPHTSEALIHVVRVHPMIRRLARAVS